MLSDAAADPLDAGPSGGARVRLRVFQGIVNLPGSYLCHDPDYTVDLPETQVDESDAGASPPVELPLLDGGLLQLGVASSYTELAPLLQGAITVHRVPLSDGGSAAVEAGSLNDGEAPDGGDSMVESPPARCASDSLEALMPLPAELRWISAPGDADAGASADGGIVDAGGDAGRRERGFVATAAGGDTLTLYGSGFALDAVELARREKAQVDAVFAQTGNGDMAAAAGRRKKHQLEASYGPRFLLSRAGAADVGSFALSFSHLIPDVPAVPVGQSAPDTGSGALHLCMTVAGVEDAEAFDGSQGFEFRNFTAISSELLPAVSYRFRVFVQADFPAGPSACATTSLKPVAELLVDGTRFVAGGSYTLVAWGALASEAICTGATPLVRAGCSLASEKLRPQLDILDN